MNSFSPVTSKWSPTSSGGGAQGGQVGAGARLGQGERRDAPRRWPARQEPLLLLRRAEGLAPDRRRRCSRGPTPCPAIISSMADMRVRKRAKRANGAPCPPYSVDEHAPVAGPRQVVDGRRRETLPCVVVERARLAVLADDLQRALHRRVARGGGGQRRRREQFERHLAVPDRPVDRAVGGLVAARRKSFSTCSSALSTAPMRRASSSVLPPRRRAVSAKLCFSRSVSGATLMIISLTVRCGDLGDLRLRQWRSRRRCEFVRHRASERLSDKECVLWRTDRRRHNAVQRIAALPAQGDCRVHRFYPSYCVAVATTLPNPASETVAPAVGREGRGLLAQGHPPPAAIARRLQGQEGLRRRLPRHRVPARQPLRADADRPAQGIRRRRACSSWRSTPTTRTRSSRVSAHAQERDVPFPVLKDFDQKVADALRREADARGVRARRRTA